MPIPFYFGQAHGGKLLSLDDQSVWRDGAALNGSGGTAYTAKLRSTSLSSALSLGWNVLRRFAQRLVHLSSVTVKMRAYRDERDSGQEITRSLGVSDVGIVTAPFKASGSAVAVEVEVSGFNAEVQLGDAGVWIVPKRSSR